MIAEIPGAVRKKQNQLRFFIPVKQICGGLTLISSVKANPKVISPATMIMVLENFVLAFPS
jgi:hypothetical protein